MTGVFLRLNKLCNEIFDFLIKINIKKSLQKNEKKYGINDFFKVKCFTMKVIFLDIDGVLSPLNNLEVKLDNKSFPYDIEFSQEAVKNLKMLLEKSQAQIVLSTRWVNRLGVNTTISVLASHGIRDPFVVPESLGIKEILNDQDWINDKNYKMNGVTVPPKKMSSENTEEIGFWLNNNINKIESYVVLDDDFMYHHSDRQVRTKPDVGLTESDVVSALDILERKVHKVKKTKKK